VLSSISNLDEYVAEYGTDLQSNARNAISPMHTPGMDDLPEFHLLRTLKPAQAHVVAASQAALTQHSGLFLGGEMGVGKTTCAIATFHRDQPYRALVFAPGHVTEKWEREIRETIGDDIPVTQIRSWQDVTKLSGHGWFIIARDTAKLGADHRPIEATKCPGCGSHIDYTPKQMASKRRQCECGEQLWTYTRTKRIQDRWSPAKYIHRKLRGFFDFLVVDEAHEEKSATTLQARAVGSLMASVDKTILLTGTLIGGYAEHLRPLLWKVNPQTLLGEGHRYEDSVAFSALYGRIESKHSVSEAKGKKRSSKSMSLRPGIMPTLFGRHLLGCSVFLSLDEVSDDLPPLMESVVGVNLDPDIHQEYLRAGAHLYKKAMQLAARRDLRMCGTMNNVLLNYIDHPFGWDTQGYLDDDGVFVPVCNLATFSPDRIYPKEQKLLDLCLREGSEGRKAWVYVLNTTKRDVVARLERILTDAGLKVAVLRSKVKLNQREAWIREHAPDCDVCISHPKLVETGLDLFDKGGAYNFPTLIFYETPVSLFTLRQASRRHWRIAQPLPCRTYYLRYNDTMQEDMIHLMSRKLAAATALEGKFSSDGLVALAGESETIELSLARSVDKQLDNTATQRDWE